jgi:hypothetical protein
MPLLLSLAFLIHLALCGRAMFSVLGVPLGHIRTWLLAPTLGLAVIGLAIMVLNQAALPVRSFALPLLLGTLFGAGGVLVRARVRVPRALLPFGAVALAALLLGGWPALVHGIGWVGYGNDDMTNYCMSAVRFLNHGFYDLPTHADLAGGDYSQIYWLMNVAGFIRFGSEHLIAFAAGATGLGPVQVFMPVILGLALTQLAAVMALVFTCPRRRNPALVAGVILAVSPLWYYGTMNQLIAQVAGLALLLAALALTARGRFPRRRPGQVRIAAVSALLLAGLGIYYPEVIPFYVFGWGLHLLLRPRRLGRELPRLLPTAGVAALIGLALLRHNVLTTALTLLGQAQDGLSTTAVTARVALFPYFLMPLGPAFFFGFDTTVAPYPEAWTIPALIAGFVALAILLAGWTRGLRDRALSATMLAGMILVGAKLFSSNNGFGLFKLAMFALPFIAIELARFTEIRRGRYFIRAAFLLLLPVWIAGSYLYTQASLVRTASRVGELFDASDSLGRLPIRSPAPVWSDIASSPVAKMLMLEGADLHPAFLSKLYGEEFMGIASRPWPDAIYRRLPGPAVDDTTAARLVRYLRTEVYEPAKAAGLDFLRRAGTETTPVDPETLLVTSRAEVRSFNKLDPGEFARMRGLFDFAPVSRLENHLAFIRTDQGQHYYLGDAGDISVYKPEPDPYAPGNYFFVIGRYLLFRVINPTATVRLRLSLTASILGEGRTALPTSARLRGAAPEGVALGLVGSGSANAYSPPLRPLSLHGASYVVLDLGRPPLSIGRPASGMQGIYNRNLSLDTRLGLGWCRDVSLISEPRYDRLPRQREVGRFPRDLTGKDAVEYSGLYEDGWVSQQAFVVLGPAREGDRVVVSALRPQIPGQRPTRRRAELLVDGVRVATQEISPGEFRLEARLVQTAPFVRIELRFDRTDTLPAPDNRPVSALLQTIQILPAP